MRQEMKVGFAIGGVLLAVLVVYVLVVSGHDKKTDSVALDTGGPAVSFPADHADASSKTDTSKTNTASKVDASKPTAPEAPRTDLLEPDHIAAGATTQQSVAAAEPAAPANDPWSAMLSTGKLPPTLISQTPTAVKTLGSSDEVSGNLTLDQKLEKVSSAHPLRATRNTVTEKPATQPTETASSDKPRTHTVQSGETFSSISQAVYGSTSYYPHILRANPNVDPRKLKVGTVLTIPALDDAKSDTIQSTAKTTGSKTSAGDFTPKKPIDDKTQYVVQSGDSLYRISVKLYGKASYVDKLAQANAAEVGPERRLKVGQVLTLPEPPTATH